jgi:3-oxoacyl-[acyl-carrier protein] reductase
VSARDLEGKVIVVTGGSRGIGREIVLGAAARGAQVAFCGRTVGQNAQTVKEEAEHRGGVGRVIAVRADVSREDDVETLFDVTLSAFEKVDVVINNAGISRAHLLVSTSLQVWDDVIATNLTGAFLVARRAIKEFLARGEGGTIISIGSITQNGAPSNASYATSKGGLVGLTHSIAKQYGTRGIRAYLAVVGYADTDIMRDVPEALTRLTLQFSPQKRVASPKEIASAVFFLAANQALCMNGEAIDISGGWAELPGYA